MKDIDLPSTASSMSASSKTMNGAFPPASKETLLQSIDEERNYGWKVGIPHFFSVEAAIPANSFATGVDPVKLTFLTVLLSHISFPTSMTLFCVVTMLITPSGTPARPASYLISPSDNHKYVETNDIPLRGQGKRTVSQVVVL